MQMKLTPAHRKAINAYARKTAFGPLDHVEIGSRYCHCDGHSHRELDGQDNLMFFEDQGCDHDLSDFTYLRDLKAVDETADGRVVLDTWVYVREGFNRYANAWDTQLSHNVRAEFEHGLLVSLSE